MEGENCWYIATVAFKCYKNASARNIFLNKHYFKMEWMFFLNEHGQLRRGGRGRAESPHPLDIFLS